MPKLNNEIRKKILDYFPYKALHKRYKVLDDLFDIKDGDIVIDGGGFHGDMAIYFSNRVGKRGKVYTFEPIRFNSNRIKINIERFNCNNVKVFNQALWNKNEEIPFYLSNYPNAGSLLKDFRKVTPERTMVRTTTLDEVVEENDIPKVDFIWTNIEGSELKALEGMKDTLSNNNCKLCICTHVINDDYQNTNDVMRLLTKYGYSANPVDDNHVKWIYAEKK